MLQEDQNDDAAKDCLDNIKSAWRFQRQLYRHEKEMAEYWQTRTAYLRWRMRVAEQLLKEAAEKQK